VVADGISGYVCSTFAELVEKARCADSAFNPLLVRRYVENNFSAELMADKYATFYREMVGGEQSEPLAAPVKIDQLPAEPEEPRAIA
jgi:hypothetical protein